MYVYEYCTRNYFYLRTRKARQSREIHGKKTRDSTTTEGYQNQSDMNDCKYQRDCFPSPSRTLQNPALPPALEAKQAPSLPKHINQHQAIQSHSPRW